LTAAIALSDPYANLVTNTTGSSITVTLTRSAQTGAGGTVTPSSLSIANGASTSALTFSEIRNTGTGSVTMTAATGGQTLTALLSS
jgi:hypothetical protein